MLNTINFKKSMRYNPFAYIHSEKDILKLVTCLITNTTGQGKSGDEFWVNAEKLLYTALIGYIHYEAPPAEQNFGTMLEMLNSMEVREDDEEFKNRVDLLMEDLERRKQGHFASRQYAKFKLAAGKTAKSILVSCGARLSPFDIAELRDVTAYDELSLDTIGDKKTALFLIMSDTDSTFNFLISMVYSQLFNLLCEKADDVYGGRLPVHVRCLIDECANIGQIPNLEKLMFCLSQILHIVQLPTGFCISVIKIAPVVCRGIILFPGFQKMYVIPKRPRATGLWRLFHIMSGQGPCPGRGRLIRADAKIFSQLLRRLKTAELKQLRH